MLGTAAVSGSLLAFVKEVGLAYCGHVLRKEGDCLEKELVQGAAPGSRARGGPGVAWMDSMESWTGLSLTELTRKVEVRHQWRKIVHGVANPRNEDGKRQADRQLLETAAQCHMPLRPISGRGAGSCTTVGPCSGRLCPSCLPITAVIVAIYCSAMCVDLGVYKAQDCRRLCAVAANE